MPIRWKSGPRASTQKYANGEADPAKAGRELGVGTVVAGHFLRQDNTVRVTLEAVEVKDNRLVWTGTLTSPADNLIALQNQMAKKVRQELVPALGMAREAVERSSTPTNREAYDEYLRSAVIARWGCEQGSDRDTGEVGGLDPNYAPAWDALGRRYYFDAIYSNGGEAGIPALECGVPAGAFAGTGTGECGWISGDERSRGGNLDQAYSDARALVQRRPDNAFAHYSLAYVSRYAGLLDEAQSECDMALAIDSGNYNWRSCAFAFFEQGKAARAMQYLSWMRARNGRTRCEFRCSCAKGR